MRKKQSIRRGSPVLVVILAVLAFVGGPAPANAAPSKAEQTALDEWARQISAAVVYTRDGRIRKTTLKEPAAVDLGPGEYARWSPDGARLVVYHRDKVYVMNADGSNRREVVSDADDDDGPPVEFHTNGEEIIYWKNREGFFAVHLDTGKKRKLNAPAVYSGEPCISADGTRLAARWGNDLYLIDLTTGVHRKYARGCSPGVSPSGKLVMNNTGGHKQMEIRQWDGSGKFNIDAATCLPDRQWDNHHWSNHEDYIAAQGERRGDNIYLFNVSKNRGLRVSWEKGIYPDAHVVPREDAPMTRVPARPPPVAAAAIEPAPQPPMFADTTRWPGDHSRLVFLWENAEATNEILDGKGRPVRFSRASPTGAARYGRHFEMVLAGGSFLTEDTDDLLLRTARETGELAIEMVFTPEDPALAKGHPLGRLVVFSQGTHERNVTVNQSGDQLQIHLRTSRAPSSMMSLGRVVPGETTHLLVAYRDGELVAYRNGRRIGQSDRIRGDFSAWEPGVLAFGDESTGGRDWAGSLERIAIYGRFIGPDEAAAKHRLCAARLDRKPAPRFTLHGELLETSAIPDPVSIHPYRRALVVGTFRVGVVEGLRTSDGKIQVAQWGILDGGVVPAMRALKPGDSYPLVLEPFEAHPQLGSERQVSDSDAFDLPLYYDPRPPGGGERPARLND